MNDFYLSFETLFHLKMLANARSLSQILMIFIFKIIQVDIMLWLYSLFISGINLPLAVDRALLEAGATSCQLGGDGGQVGEAQEGHDAGQGWCPDHMEWGRTWLPGRSCCSRRDMPPLLNLLQVISTILSATKDSQETNIHGCETSSLVVQLVTLLTLLMKCLRG